MGMTLFFLQLSLKKLWFVSSHDSQWLYKHWFKSAQDLKWISEIWFKLNHDSKSFQDILIQINSLLKKTFQNFDSNKLMTKNLPGILIWVKSWFNALNQLFNLVTFIGPSLNFVAIFGDFHSISLTFFGHSQNFVDLLWAFNSSALMQISSWLKKYLEDLNQFNSWHAAF